MNNGFIKVAAVTPRIRVADVTNNATEIVNKIAIATIADVDIIVFPSLSITGVTCGDLLYQNTLIDAAKAAVERIASTMPPNIIAVVGVPLQINGRLCNSATVLQNGKILGIATQNNVPGCSESCFKNGDYFHIFRCVEDGDFSFAVVFDEDINSETLYSEMLAKGGANVIFNLSAKGEQISFAEKRLMFAKYQSERLVGGYVHISAGMGESTSNLAFSGHNIIAENGKILAQNEPFSDDMVITDIDVEMLKMLRLKKPLFMQNAVTVQQIAFNKPIFGAKLDRKIPFNPFNPSYDISYKAVVRMQAEALAKRIMHTRVETVEIGISGGLDSTLALLVCVKAMELCGKNTTDIVTVSMPCFGTSAHTKNNAKRLCEAFNTAFMEIDITKSVVQHFTDIGHDINIHDVTFENAQARERTQVLMDIANMKNGLVVGTGDLSELALGFGTYGGDLSSMYGVNASIPKTLVRYLTEEYAKNVSDLNIKAILKDVLETPISPELLPPKEGEITQITEDLVGKYELHDFFIYYMVLCGLSPLKIHFLACNAFNGRYDAKTISKWEKVFYKRFFAAQFKRSAVPDGAKVTAVSLAPSDFKMPSDAVATAWLDDIYNI